MKLDKKHVAAALLLAAVIMIAGVVFKCAGPKKKPVEKEAVYLGVKNYGAVETNKEHRDDFLYRFEEDGGEKEYRLMNGEKDADGNYDYPLQNQLKEGYR